MKKINKKTITISVLTVLFFLCSCIVMTGCGKKISVEVTDNGRKSEYECSADMTVGDFLKENNISLEKEDIISVAENSALKDGDSIVIDRIRKRNITRTKAIKFETETEYSSDMYEGETKVTREGKNGRKAITYAYKYKNGYLISKKAIKSEVMKKPVNKIITAGTKQREETPLPNTSTAKSKKSGKSVVSRVRNYDCDGSGHGYYVITYSDGSVSYQDF